MAWQIAPRNDNVRAVPYIQPMLSALYRAFGNLCTPGLRRIVVSSLALTVASFTVLWLALAVLVSHISFFAWPWLDWLVDLLGALAVLVLSWLLFPAVATLVMGFFLERIATAVEALDYPANGPARRVSLGETVVTTLRLMSLTILLNLLALPIYVLLPGVNFFVFLGLNGYLFGREYFEVVALRRLDPIVTRGARRRFSGRLFVGGVMIAGLFAVPFVNLVAPVIATAFMVHIFEALRRTEPTLPAARSRAARSGATQANPEPPLVPITVCPAAI
jgi:CysZ protein